MNNERKAMLAAAAAYCIFGLSYLFSSIALNVVGDPVILLSIRFCITFIALNVLVATRLLKLELKGKNLVPPILLGVLQPVLYFFMENYGLIQWRGRCFPAVPAHRPVPKAYRVHTRR